MPVGTNGMLEGDIIEVEKLEALKSITSEKIKDKIVFINKPFDQKLIRTFSAYGACWPVSGHKKNQIK